MNIEGQTRAGRGPACNTLLAFDSEYFFFPVISLYCTCTYFMFPGKCLKIYTKTNKLFLCVVAKVDKYSEYCKNMEEWPVYLSAEHKMIHVTMVSATAGIQPAGTSTTEHKTQQPHRWDVMKRANQSNTLIKKTEKKKQGWKVFHYR